MTGEAMHFEELWEKCENFHRDAKLGASTQSVVDELIMKINLYKAIADKKEIPDAEYQKIKSRTLGEILLTMTKLSLQEDINVFEALGVALQYRNVDQNTRKNPA
jgi:hypothetical protein